MSPTREPLTAPPSRPAPIPPPPSTSISHTPRRSGRQRQAPSRLGYDGKQGAGYYIEPSAWIFAEFGLPSPPLALKKVSPSDPDTLSYKEAMSDTSNLDRWMAAAAVEIVSLEKNGTWTETETASAKSRILPCSWVFKRKRTPDGEISKNKARYCVRDDLEEGKPETFAPPSRVLEFGQVVSHIGTDPQLGHKFYRFQQRFCPGKTRISCLDPSSLWIPFNSRNFYVFRAQQKSLGIFHHALSVV